MPSKTESTLFRSLTRRADFLDLKATGQTVHVNFWLLVNVRPTNDHIFRCGFTLTRFIGPAVVRNRLRRWGREYLRRWLKTIAVGFDVNLVFKRREKDFYRNLKHADFDVAMDKMVAKLGRVRA